MVGFFNKTVVNKGNIMDLDFKQLTVAIRSIAEEKNLPEDVVKNALEQALAAAYRRDYGERDQEIRISININSGDVDAFIVKDIVDKVSNPAYEISLSDAKKINNKATIGETVEVKEQIKSFGRVAAQTAKQVILQKLREAEREIIMTEYEDKIGTVLNGLINRIEGGTVRVDLGKAQGIMPRNEQIQNEHYYPGQRVKVYLKEVEKGFRGPQLIVSRGNKEFIEWLFRSEVPEMESGAVEIKAIAREPGVRSKIAVASNVPGIDPIGTFVGGHGTRVNAVMNEIGEQEKIDIIVYSEDTKEFITNALSPTNVKKITINDQTKRATIVVDEDQLSIAIGKGGQNVRLASKLTGYEIDIVQSDQDKETKDDNEKVTEPEIKPEKVEQAKPVEPIKLANSQPGKIKKKTELESSLIDAIETQDE